MRRMLTIFLVLVLAVGCGAARADYETTSELHWEETVAQLKEHNIKGSFWPMGDSGFKIWLPSSIAMVQLTDEMKEDGMMASFLQVDGKAGLIVRRMSSEDPSTIDDVIDGILIPESVPNWEKIRVNGRDAVFYTSSPENNFNGLILQTGEQDYLILTFYPMVSETFFNKTMIMISSIMEE